MSMFEKDEWDVYKRPASATRDAYKLAHQMASQDALRWKHDLERAREKIETLGHCLNRIWNMGLVPEDDDIWDEVVDALQLGVRLTPLEEE